VFDIIKTLSPQSVSRLTVIMVGFLLVIKLFAYVQSGSTAVLSSLMDSVVDIGLSSMTLLALTWSAKPKDDDHRHGHGKIEGVSALLQAAFMMGAASFLVLESTNRFLKPQEIDHHIFTACLLLVAMVISFVISTLQIKTVEHSGSLALKADHAHYDSDVWLNGAVFLVIMMDYFHVAPVWLDPLAGVAIATLFARTAFLTATDAIDLLMDRELTGDVREVITAIIQKTNGVICHHDLRITGMAPRLFISVDIEVDADLSLRVAHDIARDLEQNLLDIYPRSEIFIHIDPEGDPHDSRH
jgi:ferrous-iron efflux pump FieF